MKLFLTALVIVILAMVAYSVNRGPRGSAGDPAPAPAPRAAAAPRPAVDASPEAQAKRRKLIDDLVARGVFAKTEAGTGGVVRVVVGPGFGGLDVEQKKTFLSMVLAYYRAEDERAHLVRLTDGGTGKSVGSYSAEWGLALD